MIKQLLKQIWTQRTMNVWIWLELVIVFICLSYVVDYLYSTAITYYSPLGFDVEHVYTVELDEVPSNSESYIKDQTDSVNVENLMTVMDRLRIYPGIESACVTLQRPGYSQRQANGIRGADSTWVHGWVFQVTPEFFRVFRVADKNGEIDPLVEVAMHERTFIVSADAEREFAEKGMEALNFELKNKDEETAYASVRAVTQPFRFDEFEQSYPAFYMCMSEINTFKRQGVDAEIAVRVRADLDTPEFIREFRNAMRTQLRLGNIYLMDITSFKDIRTNFFRASGEINKVKTHVAGMFFLLVNILLGVIGTFWIRTQQRKSEVALRMALGASRIDIRKYLATEGMLLLFLAVIPASVICINILLNVVDNYPFTADRFLAGQLLTLILVSVMIGIGVHFPSSQAMKIQSAEALHEE